MTTLKLSKNPADAPVAQKTSARRADPAKRDRSKPFVKPDNQNQKMDSRLRGNDEPKNDGSRQRNHRHDGTLHEQQTPDSRAPADRPILRSEHKGREFSKKPESAQKSSLDTTRPFADREGANRNPPRRGGKARDGFVASEFDKTRAAKEATHKIAAAKLPQKEDSNPRLSKLMAELGICSRREADDWIVNGWVKVDGVIIDVLGSRVKPDAEIVVSGYAKEYQAESVTILLHKPVGFVSGQAEDGYQPAIVLVHPDNEWLDDPDLFEPKEFQRGFLHGLAPAGRLDIDSTGLLVLTQDGRIARHLIGEDSKVEKEYLVRVEGELSDADMKKLNHGLSLDGVALKPAKVSWQNEDQLRFVLREGKKRQIRRMCEMVGLHVVGLKRVRIGSVNLGKLPLGQWRYLRTDERF